MKISIKELTIENEPRELEAILFGRRAALPEEGQRKTPQRIAKMDAPVAVRDGADIKRIADGLVKRMVHGASKAGGAVSDSDTGEKPENDRVTISRRDLYCIARLLKSANYALTKADKGGLFDDCEKCRFQCNTEDNYDSICKILTRETGITLFAPHDWTEKWPPRGAMAKANPSYSTERISISRRDLYCIARLLQSEKYTHNPFEACRYCKYQCSTEKDLLPNYEHVLFGLQDMTGVDFGVGLKSTEERLSNVRPIKQGNDFSTMGITETDGARKENCQC